MDTQLNENLKVKNIKQNTMDGKITSPRLELYNTKLEQNYEKKRENAVIKQEREKRSPP